MPPPIAGPSAPPDAGPGRPRGAPRGGPPQTAPIGLALSRTAKAVSRAFDDALVAAGGSLPTWLIMISLRTQTLGNQRELADAVGIKAATLTHHLNAMEAGGLVTRRRQPGNRRVHDVQLTERGEELFHRLAAAAVAHDRRLRADLTDEDLATLTRLLDRLRENVADPS
jgi:MarR family transcriptional regulator for hemolysin